MVLTHKDIKCVDLLCRNHVLQKLKFGSPASHVVEDPLMAYS